MNCIAPPALTDLDLAIYLDGEADAAVAHHVAACPACRANATILADRQISVLDQLYRSNCPTPEELRDYQLGFLKRADRSNIVLHLARCPHCTHELFTLQAFMAKATVEKEPAPATNLLDQVKLLVATLISASSPLAPASMLAGQRGVEPSIRLYQAGDVQIGLEVVTDPESGQREVHGMITSAELDNLIVHLWRNGRLLATTPVDALLGDFRFTNLPVTAQIADQPDTYELIVSAQQTKFHVPQLRLDD